MQICIKETNNYLSKLLNIKNYENIIKHQKYKKRYGFNKL